MFPKYRSKDFGGVISSTLELKSPSLVQRAQVNCVRNRTVSVRYRTEEHRANLIYELDTLIFSLFYFLAQPSYCLKQDHITMDRKIEKKTWTWQRITLIIGGVAALTLLISAIINDSGPSRLRVESDRLLLDTVQHGNFQEFIPVTGIVLPLKTVFLDAVESGKVEEKYVEDGTIIKQGAPILRLTNPDLQSEYLNLEAQIVAQINQMRANELLREQQSLNLKEQALDVEFQLDLLSKRTQRQKELYAEKAVARVDYEETQDEYEHLQRRRKLLAAVLARDSASQIVQQQQLEASLDLMERNLKFAAQSLDNLTVRAPIDGQLSGLSVELGELVSQGGNIAQIDDLSNFKVRARTDEFYISRIVVGQQGRLQFAGKEYSLTIQKIYPQVTNGEFEFDLLFDEAAPPDIRRGQSFTIRLELSEEDQGLLLAKGAYYNQTGGNWVYVYQSANGTAYKRDIQIGRQNPNFYEVLSGLQPGEIVIVSSYESFGDKDELIIR